MGASLMSGLNHGGFPDERFEGCGVEVWASTAYLKLRGTCHLVISAYQWQALGLAYVP